MYDAGAESAELLRQTSSAVAESAEWKKFNDGDSQSVNSALQHVIAKHGNVSDDAPNWQRE